MNIIERLNNELDLINDKQPIQEYKKWRRPKTKKASSKNYLMIVDKLSTAVQLYDKSIKHIINQNPTQQLSKDNKDNIIMLLNEFDRELDIIDKQAIKLESDELTQIKQKIELTKQNNEEAKEVLNKSKVFKIDIENILNYLEELVTAKISQGAFRSLALSNPLTAVIYQNWDIPKGVYNAIRES